jgi:hypothetical protein
MSNLGSTPSIQNINMQYKYAATCDMPTYRLNIRTLNIRRNNLIIIDT